MGARSLAGVLATVAALATARAVDSRPASSQSQAPDAGAQMGIPWRQVSSIPDSARVGESGLTLTPDVDSPDGSRVSYRFAGAPNTRLRSANVRARAGSTLRLHVKASRPGTVAVRVDGGRWTGSRVEWSSSPAVEMQVDSVWREVRATVRGTGVSFARVTVRTVRQRGALLVTRPQASGAADACGGRQLWTSTASGLFYRDETVPLRWVRAAEEASTTLRVGIRDASDSLVATIIVPAGSRAGAVIVPELPPGWYRVGEIAKACGDESAFVILPRLSSDRRAPGLGLHVEMDDAGIDKAARLGAGSLRLHRSDITAWPVVEPRRGQERYPDAAVARARSAGFELLGMLDRSPAWASSQPEARPYPWASFYFGAAAAPPRDLRAWHAYAARMAARYVGSIAAWEVWNEPDVHFLTPARGSTHDAVWDSLVRPASSAIRTNCPTCRVVGPAVAYALTADPVRWPDSVAHLRQSDFLARARRAGSLDLVDVFSYHAYVRPGNCASTPACNPAVLRALVATERDAGRSVWRTEAGVDLAFLPASCAQNDSLDIRLATTLVTDIAASLAAGVERVFAFHGWYSDRPCDARALFFEGTVPRRSAAAFAALAAILPERTVLERTAGRVDNQPVVAIFATERDTVWMLAPAARARVISWSAPSHVTNEWGRPAEAGPFRLHPDEIAYLWGSSSSFTIRD